MSSLISKIFITVFVFGIISSKSSLVLASPEGDLYFLAQKSFYQLKSSSEKQKFRHHWMKTIKMFSKVIDRFPKSNEACKAEFTIGKLYEGLNAISKNSKDLEKAAHHYNQVYTKFSAGSLADDALYRTAEIYLINNKINYASILFKKITIKYPKGDQVKKAIQKYKSLKVISASRNVEKTVTVKISKQQKLFSGEKRSLLLKKKASTSITTANDKVREVVKINGKNQKNNLNKRGEEKILQPLPVKLTRQISKKVFKPTINPPKVASSKKKVNVKDGLEGGYLYSPKNPKNKNSEVPLIVVDAGHGGKDHGAMSATGIKEKNVNLIIAKHIKTILVNRYKYHVVMTRRDDTFIPLKDRSKISNIRNANLFVSIHANAAKRKSAHGIETYFLGESHDKQALATAARENGEIVKSVNDNGVQQILFSMISRNKINNSSWLAGIVQKNLYRSSKKINHNLKDLGVKEGPFYVLHGADMPSILVEVGFLTNPREAKMLTKSEYLYRLASSIAEGIHKYMKDKGPSI